MTKKKSNYIFKFFLICVFTTSLYSHSRTAFSRPGTFIRTPSSLVDKNYNRYFNQLLTKLIDKDIEATYKDIKEFFEDIKRRRIHFQSGL